MIDPPRLSRRTAVAALAVAGIGAACRANSVASTSLVTVDTVAERYVRLTLELAQHQPSLVEHWLGPDTWRPGPRRPVAEIRAEIALVRTAVMEAVADERDARVRYLRQQLDALVIAARRLAGESMPFADEARASLGSDVADVLVQLRQADASGDSTTDAASAELDERLPGTGPLHERYVKFRLAHAIAPTRVVPALQMALEVCRRRLRPHISLPGSENVRLETATGFGLAGRAFYEGGFRTRVVIDTSNPMDLARLVWLVAHETYPGHHVQHVLADRDLVIARGWHERALHSAFGRHLLCAEGAAEAGAALLLHGAAFAEVCCETAPVAGTPARDVANLVAVHRAAAAREIFIAAIAGAYLDGELGAEAATDRLTTHALVPAAHQLLLTIERQRARLLAYPIGGRLVTAEVFRAPAETRWQRLAQVASTLTI